MAEAIASQSYTWRKSIEISIKKEGFPKVNIEEIVIEIFGERRAFIEEVLTVLYFVYNSQLLFQIWFLDYFKVNGLKNSAF